MSTQQSTVYYDFLLRLQDTFSGFEVGYGIFEDKPLGFRKMENEANRRRHSLRDASHRGPAPELNPNDVMFGIHDFMGYTHGKCIGPVYEGLAFYSLQFMLLCHRREYRESAKFYQPYWNIDFGLMSDKCTSTYPHGSMKTHLGGVNVLDKAEKDSGNYSPSKAFRTDVPLRPFEGITREDVQGWFRTTKLNLTGYRRPQTTSGPNNGAGALVEAVVDPSNAFKRDYSADGSMPRPEDIFLSVVLSMATNPPRLEGLNASVTDKERKTHIIPPVDFAEILDNHNLMDILEGKDKEASAWQLADDDPLTLSEVESFERKLNKHLLDSMDTTPLRKCEWAGPPDPIPHMPTISGGLQSNCSIPVVDSNERLFDLRKDKWNETRLSNVPEFQPPRYPYGIPARGLGMLSKENFEKMDALYSYPLAESPPDGVGIDADYIYLPDRFWCEDNYLVTSPLRLALVMPRSWTAEELSSVMYGVCYTVRQDACPKDNCVPSGMSPRHKTQFGQNCTAALYRKFINSMVLSKNRVDTAWSLNPWTDRVIVMEMEPSCMMV
ncbi:MAG: uncharacterized protein KVP18_000048 [Porospora cf. gigantea A]|uniref:uncharacterized protein n=1 Tax=Porospora cf. gigantea A TaxID=2853593 RepID=UPI003559985D|nr:MAG: hypothetical protein KVP18_000048 [Porospora cf. gigantea A]